MFVEIHPHVIIVDNPCFGSVRDIDAQTCAVYFKLGLLPHLLVLEDL